MGVNRLTRKAEDVLGYCGTDLCERCFVCRRGDYREEGVMRLYRLRVVTVRGVVVLMVSGPGPDGRFLVRGPSGRILHLEPCTPLQAIVANVV